MREKPDVMKIDKDNFIEFMTHATPEDLNDLILNRGKPAKPYCPFYIFRDTENSSEKTF